MAIQADARFWEPHGGKMDAQVNRRSYRTLAIWGSLLLSVAFLWKLWADGYLISSEKTLPPGIYPSSAKKKGDLRISGSVERSHLRTDETMLIWLTLENTGAAPLSDINLFGFQTDGFKKDGSCWLNGLPNCLAGEPLSSASRFRQERLDARSAVTLWGEITPSSSKGSFRPSVTVTWREGQNEQPPLVLLFPDIKIQHGAKARMAKLGVSVYGLFKDFAIPVVALIVGFFFDRIRHREQKAAEKAAERENQAAQKAARKEAQIRQTWNSMLPKVHRNAELHYLPISSEIQNLLLAHGDYMKEFQDGKPGMPENLGPGDSEIEARILQETNLEKHEEKVMFHLMRLYRRFKNMSHNIGGFYFKSRKGEHMAADAWNVFYELLFDYFDYHDTAGLIQKMDPQEDIDTFLARGSSQGRTPDLASMETFVRIRETAFIPWLREASLRDLDVLRILEQVLDYEMNRPYRWWYGREEDIDIESCMRWREQLKNHPKAETAPFFDTFMKRGEKYFENLESEEEAIPIEHTACLD